MPHFSWTVDIGNLVSWILAIGAAVYRFGMLTQVVTDMKEALQALRIGLSEHAAEDARRFEAVQSTIEKLLLKEGP